MTYSFYLMLMLSVLFDGSYFSGADERHELTSRHDHANWHFVPKIGVCTLERPVWARVASSLRLMMGTFSWSVPFLCACQVAWFGLNRFAYFEPLAGMGGQLVTRYMLYIHTYACVHAHALACTYACMQAFAQAYVHECMYEGDFT